MEKEATGVQTAKRPSDPYSDSVILSNGKEVPICKAGDVFSRIFPILSIFSIIGETIFNPIST